MKFQNCRTLVKRGKISTSKDLLQFYPFLERQKEWAKFAEAFDKPECRKNRGKAARALEAPEQPDEIREMLNHCNWVLRAETLSLLPKIDDDGKASFQTPEQDVESHLKAATALAEKVELLLSDSEAGAEMRSGVEQAVKSLKHRPDTRSIIDAFKAMCLFIRREQRLPSKKELNIEAFRMKWNECHVMEERPKFGQLITLEKSTLDKGQVVSREVPYRVYDFKECYGLDDEYNEGKWIECRLVRDVSWNELYWKDPREIWKPGGFSGLPKAGRSQVGGEVEQHPL